MYCSGLTLEYQYSQYIYFGMLMTNTQHLWRMNYDSHACITKKNHSACALGMHTCNTITMVHYYGMLILIT